MFGTYKAGSYKGLDLSFGNPELPATGGILLRSLMPVTVTEKDGKILVSNSGSKDEFIEGPCNCVNRILLETTGDKDKGIKDLVQMPEFNLDAFDQKSNFHLVTNVVMPTREVIKNPRVGLSLKKLDENKPRYWLADYRHLTFPEFHGKMKDFIILSMIANKLPAGTVATKASCKIAKVE